ncbi:DUF1097 domain-containing protein [Variovorax sp. NFACC27]|uniref:DUF1097 domain-containing protein n=1 Tax=unclassified Variovorax TaxID=663243 RepID=UPI000895E096|nr:Protein of unknown function [Variovorax sp. NFACC28]SEG63092.1 Protein of unknown function [Variovorax sp. NFACC29]SFC64691.1 Protein of unknown function [Variovorax sp. NFACC26]SFG82650.1 Protein of unknown function [Variovorax sp. NFACC27]
MSRPNPSAAAPRFFSLAYSAFTLAAAVVAAAASALALVLELPVWAMFVGWVAFYTRGVTARDGVFNLVCVGLGVLIGKAAALAIGALGPVVGAMALPLVVLVVALVVVSLRGVPRLNNLLCYFLGLIAFFAIHQPPSLSLFGTLAGAAALGSVAAWTAHALQRRVH